MFVSEAPTLFVHPASQTMSGPTVIIGNPNTATSTLPRADTAVRPYAEIIAAVPFCATSVLKHFALSLQ